MKYFLIFLAVCSYAYADLNEDLAMRAIREKWTFEYKVPSHHYAKGFKPKPALRKTAKYAAIKPATDLPAHFDLTSRLSPVKDQGSCGGCWAFATVGVIENFTYSDSQPQDLSEQNILDCDTQSNGCGGGDFDGFDFAKTGVASEQAYPFVGQNQTCKQVAPTAKVVSWAFVSGSENSEPTIDQIKTALYQTQTPIAVGIHAGIALESYSSGIMNSCGGFGGLNHMVDIVGWDDTDDDWIVRNSWGSSWGENGYFRIKRQNANGVKCSQIGTEAAFLSNATLVSE